ncbi:MAG TPA: hypothetical protein VJ990_03015 [Clostridia bacterium]|nr:hypothetical protein [Clostridia bacterium]
MKVEKLFEAITDLDDNLIEEARLNSLIKQSKAWKKWTAIVASVALVVVIAGSALLRIGVLIPGGSSGSNGHREGSVFMSYAGPVFPLTLSEEMDDLSVKRRIDFDFSPYEPKAVTDSSGNNKANNYVRYDSEAIVTDGYDLINTSDNDMTITAIYPFSGSLQDKEGITPVVSVDGLKIRTKLVAGPYTGSFEGVYGEDSHEAGDTYNLAHIESWEEYRQLLSDGTYMDNAFDEFPQLNQKVTVYEFSESTADHDKATNPTINIEFKMDNSKTKIFTYGFNGGSMDLNNNNCARHFSVPEAFNPDYGMSRYLIVMGDDIGDYVLQGYKNGGCDTGEELEGVTVTVDRYETTLGEVLWAVKKQNDQLYANDEIEMLNETISDKMQYELAAELLLDYGILSGDSKARYDMGILEDILSESISMDRVFYLSFDLEIPVGASVAVTMNMVKENSFDYHGSGSDNQNVDGYDLVTTLGSNLKFIEQTASIQDYDLIEIVRQNYGFDLVNGIKSVTLDPSNEHYYLEIRLKNDE